MLTLNTNLENDDKRTGTHFRRGIRSTVSKEVYISETASKGKNPEEINEEAKRVDCKCFTCG